MSNDKSVVGDLINFRGLVYAPMNENGVVFLFGKVAEDLNMYIEEIKPGFPDCIARRFEGKGWERLRVEFEFRSSNFRQHKHSPKECDLIVCWEHDWKGCPLEVIELKDRIKELDNRSTQRPNVEEGVDEEESIYGKFNKAQRELFGMIVEHVKSVDDSCFHKAGKTMLSIYSPKRSFVYVRPTKKALDLWIYTGGEKLGRVKAFGYEKAAHKWGRLRIESVGEFEKARPWIAESLVRINRAVKNNEPTGWYAKIDAVGEDE